MKRLPIILVAMALSTSVLAFQTYDFRLRADDYNYNDYFGRSVSISGDYAIIGAPYDNENGNGSGSAYIFVRDGRNWVQQQKLIPEDGAREDYFGESVSINGNYAVVGAYGDDDNGEESGSVYVFTLQDNEWVQCQKIIPDDVSEYHMFGYRVLIKENCIICGGLWDNSVYTYTMVDDEYSEQQKIRLLNGRRSRGFGCTFSLDDGYLILGVPEDSHSGAAYIFTFDEDNWTQQQKIIPEDTANCMFFGSSVSKDGDYILVGAFMGQCNEEYNHGAAYIFENVEDEWIQRQKLVDNSPFRWDYFGSAVSISGDIAIIGAPQYNFCNGEICVFTRQGDEWIQREKLTSDDLYRFLGKSIQSDGDYIIVGSNSSTACIYTFQDLVANPDSFYFGEVEINREKELNFEIIFEGIESGITITDISTETIHFTCDFREEIFLEPGDAATVRMTFTPDTLGFYNDILKVSTDNIYIGNCIAVVCGIGKEVRLIENESQIVWPEAFTLSTPFPNPFNSTTTISYTLPSASQVSLKLFDLCGREVRTLTEGYAEAGQHSVSLSGEGLSSGVYLVKMEAGGSEFVRKALLVR